jgi:hypothetical protein
MWGPISELDLPYEVRHRRRFKERYQRPLTDREKEIVARVKEGYVDKETGYKLPNIKVCASGGILEE